MIKIIAGGKKNANWTETACAEYEKRLKKPFDLKWEFVDEEKLNKKLATWPFNKSQDFVICCDERGENISSREYSQRLEQAFLSSKNVIILLAAPTALPKKPGKSPTSSGVFPN